MCKVCLIDLWKYNRRVYILGILGIFNMEDVKVLPQKKNKDTTSMKCSVGFLRFLNKHGQRGESYEQICWRLFDKKIPQFRSNTKVGGKR